MQPLVDQLVIENTTKIIFLVMDGLGGLAASDKRGTELQMAHKPNLDSLAAKSICGLMDPILPGITPGSGPAHFALFGYDPIESNIGRGVLEAAGINLPMTDRDVAIRINFATVDKNGNIIDRRAGRIDTEENRRICQKIRNHVSLAPEAEFIIETVKEHRAALLLRGDNLGGDLADTDPQQLGVPPLPPRALNPQSEKTAQLSQRFLEQAHRVLADEPKANTLLLRGFAKHKPYPSMWQRYKLKSLAVANYPMYRGIAFLLNMDLHPVTPDIKSEFEAVAQKYDQYDFFFVHVKPTDSKGEDGNFDAKVKVIEEVDSLLPILTGLNPDVMVVTADHSTPALLKAHSWHPVPVLLYSKYCRADQVQRFDEISCIQGGLGRMPSMQLMPIVLANALRLNKFGA
ncbi:MAG: 2,3-bisphosphoglycerate-independent phosphoglycerate mutase [candidate division KSB1 bacterium]|nr:2,3-bisphosphoglycerate-independent phosphoglycerate mutase [candidate division KSB1 bacterium]MDZ7317512.1 2,3-bisphosphoglycerate-independent phosphoglycerate mutase [candidate division KSB1 bacterium]MDZ7342505.1 2,3-bisphosphoglycerate-independent phosphoglycerate mutase [candidate division KSB1 bacterium]